MSITTNIESFINDIPRFEFNRINNGNAIYYALTFKYNRSYYYDPPEYLKDDVNNILSDKNFKNYIMKFIKELGDRENFTVLRNGKIIYKPVKVEEEYIQCSNCGNVWDGNAQCTCYLYELCYC